MANVPTELLIDLMKTKALCSQQPTLLPWLTNITAVCTNHILTCATANMYNLYSVLFNLAKFARSVLFWLANSKEWLQEVQLPVLHMLLASL